MSLPCSMFGGKESPENMPDRVEQDTWGQVFADLTLGERMAELQKRSLADPDAEC